MSQIIRAAIDKAIAGHSAWKRRLKDAAASGASEFKPETVRPDNLCDFGKWLYGDAAKLSAADKGADYDSVRKLHAEFHKCAADTLTKALGGDRPGYDADMGITGRFTHASAELTQAMMAWKKRLG